MSGDKRSTGQLAAEAEIREWNAREAAKAKAALDRLIRERLPIGIICERMTHWGGTSYPAVAARARELGIVLPRHDEWQEVAG